MSKQITLYQRKIWEYAERKLQNIKKNVSGRITDKEFDEQADEIDKDIKEYCIKEEKNYHRLRSRIEVEYDYINN